MTPRQAFAAPPPVGPTRAVFVYVPNGVHMPAWTPKETGATFVHAFEDERVIAGQGTIGLELAEQAPDAETVVVPIGGGGLCAGIALALKARRPEVTVVGVICQPGFTIADGIAVKHPGVLPTSILDDVLDHTVQVSDDEISEALVLCVERTKFLVEGAGAVGLAALIAGRIPGSGSVAVVLSGGNIDATTLISVLRHGLTQAGRFLGPERPSPFALPLQTLQVGVQKLPRHSVASGCFTSLSVDSTDR